MSQVIILEGPDGGGKTTLANHLRDRYGFQIRKTNQPGPGEDLLTSYTTTLLDAITSWRSCVFDRHYLGEGVYGPIMRGEDRLGEMGRDLIERLCAENGVPVLVVNPRWVTLYANWKAKNGEDYLKTTDQLAQVQREYEHQSARLDDRDFARRYVYDKITDYNEMLFDLRPCRRLPPGFTGYPEAKVLVVGEQVNLRAVPWDLAFHDLGGSSRYLYDQVRALGIPERDLAWANAYDREGEPNLDLLDAVEVMPNIKRVVSLGKRSMDICSDAFLEEREIPVLEVPHPQYWKRFHAGHDEDYQDKLKEAMGL